MADTNNITPRYLTEKEAEIYTSMSFRELQEARQQCKLRFIQTRAGGCIRYDINDIINFMENHKV